ncbi:hypothetical protein BJ912DRAFT_999603 [Pholiota molesta]|nr:hypothetical protein BJ912DRAFT_999603 [Pholiota molesta]
MAKTWDIYSRQGIDIAHKATSFGFSAVKTGTRLGFSIARAVASTAVGATTTVVDLALFGGGSVTRPVAGLAVSTVLSIAEQITLAPIHLGEYITSTSLLAAHGSINVLSVIFPGSSDASFSLVSFVGLVRRELAHTDSGSVPEKRYGLTQVARAIVGWVALQGVTQEWQEKRWFKHLKELDVMEAPKTQRTLKHKASRIRVTSDIILPGQQAAQIIAADIGDPATKHSRPFMTQITTPISPAYVSPVPLSNDELKKTMRRLSKMVLAGYGGATLLFFGVSPTAFDTHLKKKNKPPAGSSTLADAMDREKKVEEEQLAEAVDAAEAEAAGDGKLPELPLRKEEYSWWDVLLGKHDQEIFEPVVGNEHLMPRFWVLTDHDRGQDLGDKGEGKKYYVHGGMLRMAKAMGDVGKPVHLAVMEALHKHPDFDLILCGHSLGAAVAAMLGMMWADPNTCQTVRSSGLPVGRQVQVFAFGPPYLIVSLVYSHDIVSRLSLGSVRDLKNAAMWLCEAEARGDGQEGWSAVTARAKRWKDNTGWKEDMDWFIAMRKTLEANMQNTCMYPPGRVLWAMRDRDLHPAHRLHSIPDDAKGMVLDVEQVFSQTVFAMDMLSAHLPHQYDRVLHDLL